MRASQPQTAPMPRRCPLLKLPLEGDTEAAVSRAGLPLGSRVLCPVLLAAHTGKVPNAEEPFALTANVLSRAIHLT